MTFLSKEQTLDLFKNSFEIIHFNEIEKDGKTGLGKMKHWHIYNVIAKKKQYKETERGLIKTIRLFLFLIHIQFAFLD